MPLRIFRKLRLRKVETECHALFDEGEFAAAEDILRATDEELGPSSTTRRLHAICWLHKGKYGKAIRCLSEGGIRRVKSPDELLAWCKKMESERKYDLAIGLYKLLVKRFERGRGHFFFRIARLYRMRGDAENAAEYLVRTLETSKKPVCFSMIQGMQKPDEQAALLSRLPRLKRILRGQKRPSVNLNLAVAQIYRLDGDWKQSARYVRRARDRNARLKNLSAEGAILKPRFMIIGTTKSGTTSVYSTLAMHPQIVEAVRKEIHYFDQPVTDDRWYRAHFPRIQPGSGMLTGEATPNYLYFDVAKRILEFSPAAKFICMVRNPADRVVSQYFHARKHGLAAFSLARFCDTSPFTDLLAMPHEQVTERLFEFFDEKVYQQNNAIPSSMYFYFLKRWRDEVGESKLLVLNFDEYQANPQSVLDRIGEFLRIDPFQYSHLGDQNKGSYEEDADEVRSARVQMNDFFQEPNRLLREEFGIEFRSSD